MGEPTILPRSEHGLSRRDIDPDALKVLYRLHRQGFIAYLVGGSVRDLLLGRRPKDFDIGTSAHPYQVKRLFRNCWIIGRRFRLAHVRFGSKAIEVATFRRKVPAGTETEPPLGVLPAGPEPHDDGGGTPEVSTSLSPRQARADVERQRQGGDHGDEATNRIVRRDNTFGTAEEDAFRRDFTVNGLFYDIGTFAVIDYVGGLDDLAARVVRSIGEPDERFQEDPVRMLRAVVLAARLDFTLDPAIPAAIGRHGPLIALSAPARLLDEYYKILRSGAARASFERLAESGLLAHLTPELETGDRGRLNRSLDALDRYRARFAQAPETLTNTILVATLLVPLDLVAPEGRSPGHEDTPFRGQLGRLALSRRDLERAAQILAMQPRLRQIDRPQRAQRSLLHRRGFREALTWLEIHGGHPEAVAHWQELLNEPRHPARATGSGRADEPPDESAPADREPRPRRRRRRRRGRRVRREGARS